MTALPIVLLLSDASAQTASTSVRKLSEWTSTTKKHGNSLVTHPAPNAVRAAFDVGGTLSLPSFTVVNPLPTIVNQYTSPPADMIAASGGGPYISFAGLPGHTSGDSERTAFEVRSTSKTGPDVEETAQDIEINDVSGLAYNWAKSQFYPALSYVHNDRNPSKIYQNTIACRSAETGFGPTGIANGQKDGTCNWNYVYQDNDGKSASLVSGVIGPRGGKLWGQAIDVIAETGSMGGAIPGGLMVGQEIDIGNFAKDCPVGGGGCLVTGLFVAGSSKYKGTAGILGGGQPPTAPLYHQGVILLPYFATDVGFNDDSNSNVGFQSNGAHGAYAFQDLSVSPTSIAINGKHSFAGVFDNVSAVAFYSSGAHSGAAFKDDSTSSVSLHVEGKHPIAAYYDSSTSAIGIDLVGKYTKQISGEDFAVDAAGNTTAKTVRVSSVPVAALPKCDAASEGTFSAVTDAIPPTYNGKLAGGGTAHVPAYCNGRAWVAH